jgi:hypothetical protein
MGESFSLNYLEFIESRVHTNWHKKAGVTGRRLRPVRGVAEKTGAQVLQGKTWSARVQRAGRGLWSVGQAPSLIFVLICVNLW